MGRKVQMSHKKHNVQAFSDSDIVIRAVEPEIPTEEIKESAPTVDGYVFATKPIPTTGRKERLNYPIGKLEAGSTVSFLVPAAPDKVKQVTASIRQYAYRHEFNVVLRAEEGGVRVWRAKEKPVV
jgi:hypothetical protein